MKNILKLRAAGNYAERLAKIVYDLADLVEDFGNFLQDNASDSDGGAKFLDDVSSDDEDDAEWQEEEECKNPNCICKSGEPVTIIRLR
jgi:hypothetical protein